MSSLFLIELGFPHPKFTWNTCKCQSETSDTMSRRGPSHMGPYGLACMSCFKSKSKCVAHPGPDHLGCQRCHALNKPCQPSNAIRGRTAISKKPNSVARIAELESKIDGLISQLQSRKVIDGAATPTQSPSLSESPSASRPPGKRLLEPPLDAEEDDALESDPWEGRDEDCEEDEVEEAKNPNREPFRSSDSLHLGAAATPEPTPRVSDTTAETYVTTFRTYMLPHFAFIDPSSSWTAQKLQRDRPFLFRAILCAVVPSSVEKAARGAMLKKSIFEAMLGAENRTSVDRTDLLLALLTYMSWGWDHILNNCNLSRLMLQAKSLACELRLDEPPRAEARLMSLFDPAFGSSSLSQDAGAATRQDFLERQRAVLGCFVLSSVVSAHYGHMDDALRWTPQMEAGLAAIATNTACSTDALLAMQVRLQLLGQKAVQLNQQLQLHQGQSAASNDMTIYPALMDIATLQSQRHELEQSISQSLPHRGVILAHVHSTDLVMSEITHQISSMLPIMVSQFARMTGPAAMSTTGNSASTMSARQERSRCISQSMRAVQSCTSALLASPPSDFRGISFLQWAQLAHCIAALSRLTTTIDDPAWDRAVARAVVDVPALLGRVTDKLELVSQEIIREQGSDGLFDQLARIMREFCVDAAGGATQEDGAIRSAPEKGKQVENAWAQLIGLSDHASSWLVWPEQE